MTAAARPRLLTMLATVLLLLAVVWLAAPSPAAAATKCSATKCFAYSADYPKQTGWYAWIGRPGYCNSGPFPGYIDDPLTIMMCAMSPRYDAYALVDGTWVANREITAGIRGYIHPFDATWRWVYVDGTGWLAIRAAEVGILWNR
ncbi:MAG: hypothetical protein JWM90_1605 [Thermoleophilia bacterium]|nr:hypothetical protein [Thermoleophilia bacterium]